MIGKWIELLIAIREIRKMFFKTQTDEVLHLKAMS